MKKIAFINKGGTLLEDIPYNVDPGRIRFLPGVLPGLRKFQRMGFRLVVTSNEPGVAFDFFKEADLDPIRVRLEDIFAENGLSLAGFSYCPHHPEGRVPKYSWVCPCRRPAPGLYQNAALEDDVDLSASWVLSNNLDDIRAGKLAGCRTALITTDRNIRVESDVTASDLVEAADRVMQSAPSAISR